MSSVRPCEKHLTYDTIQHKYEQQEKALRHWERQQQAWARMQENIRRRVGPRGGTNMSQSPRLARNRDEDLRLVDRVSMRTAQLCPEAWPSSLRAKSVDDMERYVNIGRTNFPYPLYTKYANYSRMGPEGHFNTRVVFPGQCASSDKYSNSDNNNINNKKRKNQSTQNIDKGDDNKDEDDNDNDELEEDADMDALKEKSTPLDITVARMDTPVFLHRGDYYKEKLQCQEAYLREHMSHFMLPRAYLELCGKPPPRTVCREDWAAAERKGPPVTCAPPLAPPAQSDVSAASAALSTQSAPRRATILPVSAADKEAPALEGPYLEVSTTHVLFITRPGELAHGTVVIRNAGTTTMYYTWVPLDHNTALSKEAEEEQQQQLHAKSPKKLKKGKRSNPSHTHRHDDDVDRDDVDNSQQENVGKVSESMCKADTSTKVTIGSKLRALSTKSIQARSYFYLSSPLDGVILPGEEGTFPFSVRSPIPGRFTQHYEVLMIPAVSQLVIELCAIVLDTDLLTHAIARPIVAALDAKVVADAQRQAINAIAADPVLYEASEIRQATKAQIHAASAAAKASAAQLVQWRAAWHAANRTALSLPFNRDVYARLDALHKQLAGALSALGTALPPCAEAWDGSVLTLQAHLCLLRDAHARNTIREALGTLVRAACASESEDEALGALLLRVAGREAFAELARRAADAADTAEALVGLRSPRLPKALPAATRKGASIVQRPPARSLGRAKAFEESAEQGALVDPTDTAVREERTAWLFVSMRRAVADAVERLCAAYDTARWTVEVACHEPLLDVTESARVEDVRAVQMAEDMEVDHTVDVVPLKKKK